MVRRLCPFVSFQNISPAQSKACGSHWEQALCLPVGIGTPSRHLAPIGGMAVKLATSLPVSAPARCRFEAFRHVWGTRQSRCGDPPAALLFVCRSSTDQGGGKRRTDYALFRALRSGAHSLVGNPVAIVGNREILPPNVASRFGRRSNTMTDDFVDRLAGLAEIETVIHCALPLTKREAAIQSGP